MKIAAFAWALVVAIACAMLVFQLHRGVELQTDMTALLPAQERDGLVQGAKERVTRILAQRVFVLVGDRDRASAREAGATLAKALGDSGMTRTVTYRIRSDSLKALGAMYFPYRSGLLSDADRARLQQNQGAQIVDRAIASVYGPSSIADVNLLRHDPFLLMPEYLGNLPTPAARFSPDDGVLSMRDHDRTWVLLIAELNGNVYSGAFQERFISTFDAAERRLRATTPDLQILRVGAIFYAQAGAKSATDETTRLSIVSIVGTIALILIVFRSLRALWLTLLAIGVGVVCAAALSLWIFGGLHVAALLFGVSLIGIAIDYCLQYVSARFGSDAGTPQERLRRVLPGITIGVATTLIGYATLMLAPFPGLHQLAVSPRSAFARHSSPSSSGFRFWIASTLFPMALVFWRWRICSGYSGRTRAIGTGETASSRSSEFWRSQARPGSGLMTTCAISRPLRATCATRNRKFAR